MTHAILITPSTASLIMTLNGGVPPIVKKNTYFLCTVESPTTTTDHKIVDEDELYEMVAVEEINILLSA